MEEFSVELIEQGWAVNLYSVRFSGEEYTEFEKFMLKFPEGSEYEEDMNIILAWLNRIMRNGALERYFRPEGRYGSGVKAIPIETNKLRLYCLRLSDDTLILGNGDLKDADTWQNSPTLKPYVEILNDAERFIRSRFKQKSIHYDEDNILVGDLTFKRKHDEN